MKISNFLSLTLLISIAVACAPQEGGDGYDVSNPYAAPDYVDDTGAPVVAGDINPAYDAPAAYEDVVTTTPDLKPAHTPPAPKIHTVGRGDTLWGLSKQYGVPTSAIKEANGLTRDTIVLGAKLKIPSK